MNKPEPISIRTRSILVGVLILVAYGVLMSTLTDDPFAIMIADIVSGIAVIGIAVLMYPLFRRSIPGLPSAYLMLKMVEGLLMILAGILYLSPSYWGFRNSIYDGIHLYVFIVSGALFYILLYRRRLVPRFICVWGMAGIGFLTLSTIFNLAGMSLTFLDYFLVLIITNEVFLAIWLFAKDLRIQNDEIDE